MTSTSSSNVSWTSTTARLYQIQTSLNLTSWSDTGLGTFAPSAGTSTTRNIVETSTSTTARDFSALSQSARFRRTKGAHLLGQRCSYCDLKAHIRYSSIREALLGAKHRCRRLALSHYRPSS